MAGGAVGKALPFRKAGGRAARHSSQGRASFGQAWARTRENTGQSQASPAQDGRGVSQGFSGGAPRFNLTPTSEVRAVCGNAARTDLRGGRSVAAVHTATRFPPISPKGARLLATCCKGVSTEVLWFP